MVPRSRVIQQGGRARDIASDAIAQSGAEKRWANRRERNAPALILIEGSVLGRAVPPISCVVKDTSSTGALIEMAPSTAERWNSSSGGLPDVFRLQVPSELIEVACEVAWRFENRMGVRFSGPTTMLAKPEPAPAKAPEPPKSTLARMFKR